MPTRNVVRVPRHAIGVVKAALFPSAIPSSDDLAASGINLGITTAKAKDSSAATDLIIAHGGGGGCETAATPNKEGAVRNNKNDVVVDSEAAPDTSSAAAVNHAIQRKNFDSVLDYLETKYVKSIVADDDAEEGCNGSNNMNQSQSTIEKTPTMVTRTVVRITSLSAVAGNKPTAIKTTKNKQSEQSKKRSITSPAATPDKKDMPLQKRRKKTSCTKRAQHPSTLCWRHGAKDVTCSFDGCNKRGILLGLCPDHGGLVQLCRWKGCINKVNLERRGGMCWMHQEDSADSDSEDEESEDEGEIRLCSFKGCISVATDGGICVRHSTTYDDDCLDQGREKQKKRSLSSWDIADNETIIKRQRQQNDSFVIDLSDVPPQPPIPKSSGRIKEGASKYTGLCFNKHTNRWVAQIMIEGKQRIIGYYDEEEDAAIDYARAFFKYKGGVKRKRQQNNSFVVDLSDVPPQPPIPKSRGRIKEGASKYTGVSFHKQSNKWHTQIMIEGKQHSIGYYDDEEEAAADYARALFKYKGGAEGREHRESFAIDLSDIPPQPPIPKSSGRIKEGASKYAGVCFNKKSNKWQTQINLDGKTRLIGYYDDENEAAVDYARAVFKYKGGTEVREHRESFVIDLNGVPPQPPIPKSSGRIKEGASKYTGVSFNKQSNKWVVTINIEGKQQFIGYYDDENQAAVDYARAVFKYKGGVKRQNRESFAIDLSDIPPQPPIPKSRGRIKEGASKYTGVSFNKQSNKWHAQIDLDGKTRSIGYYDDEIEAAVDYARAVFKYKGGVKRQSRKSVQLI